MSMGTEYNAAMNARYRQTEGQSAAVAKLRISRARRLESKRIVVRDLALDVDVLLAGELPIDDGSHVILDLNVEDEAFASLVQFYDDAPADDEDEDEIHALAWRECGYGDSLEQRATDTIAAAMFASGDWS